MVYPGDGEGMLKPETIERLFHHARYKEPQEMCGLLFDDESFLPCENMAQYPEHQFMIYRADYDHACKIMKRNPCAIVHSHPNKGAAASAPDCKLMDALMGRNMHTAMVIVGLKPMEIRCFRKRDDLYNLEWVHVSKV